VTWHLTLHLNWWIFGGLISMTAGVVTLYFAAIMWGSKFTKRLIQLSVILLAGGIVAFLLGIGMMMGQ
jgi:hypothetical protein